MALATGKNQKAMKLKLPKLRGVFWQKKLAKKVLDKQYRLVYYYV